MSPLKGFDEARSFIRIAVNRVTLMHKMIYQTERFN